jgi:alkanesulfonate monooxygenase SsuD/methylene tetrahydromethanopterin reductase-like flavin-dependent oxidoreductase (luciferase family)
MEAPAGPDSTTGASLLIAQQRRTLRLETLPRAAASQESGRGQLKALTSVSPQGGAGSTRTTSCPATAIGGSNPASRQAATRRSVKVGSSGGSRNGRLGEIAADAQAAQEHGISRIWFSQRDGWDSLSFITALAPLVPEIRLGVGAVPIYPRHPLALAAQALSVQAATDNRLTLDIGSSHPVIVEGQYGLAGSLPAYRVILDRGAAAGPEDTAVLGDEAEVSRQIQRFADAGATEFMIAPVGTAEDQARTIAFAHSLASTVRR